MSIGSVFGNIAMLMAGKASPREVARVLDKLSIEPSGNLDSVPNDSVNIAVAQLLRRDYHNLGEYIADMNSYVADAANRRAHIVCFPAFTGLLPLSFLPQFSNIRSEFQVRAGDFPEPDYIRECLGYCGEVMFDAYFNTMSALAARHGVYIMAGTTIYIEDGTPRHRAFLFDNMGELAGTQDKIVPSPAERAIGAAYGGESIVFNTPMGCFSVLIGSDVLFFETIRAAKRQGAQIILNPTAFVGDYTPMDSAGGLAVRVQENAIYGVQCTMVGDTGLGISMNAPCAVYAPNELVRTRVKNGLLSQSSGESEPEILSVTLDLEVIESIKNPYWNDKNPKLLGKYLDRLS